MQKVGQVKPYELHAPIKLEYGNVNFHTAQLAVVNFEIKTDSIRIQLHAEATDCKAKELCGVPETNTTNDMDNCAPGSGCC